MQKNHTYTTANFQIFAILASSLVGVFDGMLYAWTSPSIPILIENGSTNINIEEVSYFTVISPVAMAISAPFFSMILDLAGRRIGILLVAVPAILAWLCVILCNNIVMYYVSRALAGIVDAGIYAAVPVYICEIAEPDIRNTWGNAAAITIYLGMFLINVIGSYCTLRITAMISILIPIIHVVIFWHMPESPYYLIMKKNEKAARECLKQLRGISNVDNEINSLTAAVDRQLSETGTMRDLFLIASNRKALLICAFVRLSQQLSGLAAFETYTQYMFQQAGKEVSKKTSSIIFSGFLAVCIGLSPYLVKNCKRRRLLIGSCLGCGTTLGILSGYLYIHEWTTITLSNYAWLPLTGMSLYIVFFAPGIGILPTLVLGEVFSSSIKSKAVSVMNVITAVCFLIVPKFFQSTAYSNGMFIPFATFAVCCLINAFLSYLVVIETKGKTLEDIQQELKGTQIHKSKT